MKKILFSFSFFIAGSLFAQKSDYPIQGVPFTKVKLTDNFWLPRIKTNQLVTIPASFARCESTGRVKNFEMAAAQTGKFCTIFPFDDTDIYKTIEGASFSLSLYPDPKLALYIDTYGKSFFYTNAMQMHNSFLHNSMEPGRSGWFP